MNKDYVCVFNEDFKRSFLCKDYLIDQSCLPEVAIFPLRAVQHLSDCRPPAQATNQIPHHYKDSHLHPSSSLRCQAPNYLWNLLYSYTSSLSLRSANTTRLRSMSDKFLGVSLIVCWITLLFFFVLGFFFLSSSTQSFSVPGDCSNCEEWIYHNNDQPFCF